MSGLPHLPSLAIPRGLLPAREWAKQHVRRGDKIIAKLDRWLGLRQVWPLYLIADPKLILLAGELDAVSADVETWLARAARDAEPPPKVFVDASGLRHVLTSDGVHLVATGY